MATLPSDTTPITDQLGPDADEVLEAKRRNKELRAQVTSCKEYRKKLIPSWQVSIDYRRGKPFNSQSDEDRIAVNLDWSLTKQKIALLFSQVPAVRLSHPPQTQAQDVSPWIHAYEQKINDTLVTAGAEAAMEEVLPDCINAAGIGVVLASREAITEDVEVPAIDLAMMPPELHAQIMQSGMMPDGSPVPMMTVPKVIDARYKASRISPADFLWPLEFVGSDFDNSPWVGRSGRITWAEAIRRFDLDPTQKDKYLGEERTTNDRLTNDVDKDKPQEDKVSFDEIFYKEEQFSTRPTSFTAIHHVVWVGGQEKPAIDKPWDGQEIDQESSALLGAQKYPLRVLTLTYITDEAIPPSDSAIGRPQVNELNKSRSQMMQQRQFSLPIRWANTDRVDPTLMQALMLGKWQHIVPVQGVGTNVIGEVPRSAMPQENFIFDRIIKADEVELWQVGQGATGADVETKGEVDAISGNMQVRIGRERAKVAKFYVSIAEVLGGLISIYEEPTSIGEGFSPHVSKALSYSILADSTVLLDSQQRLKRLIEFVNFTAKSGWLSLEPVLKEVATLSGLDPNVVIQPPQPKPPVEPNISLRLTGTEDLMNPLAYAFLLKSGQAPDIKLIEEAKKHILAGVLPPPPMPPGPPPIGPDGKPLVEPGMMPPGMLGPPQEPVGPAGPAPMPPAPPVGSANPDWSAMGRVNQRVVDRENQ